MRKILVSIALLFISTLCFADPGIDRVNKTDNFFGNGLKASSISLTGLGLKDAQHVLQFKDTFTVRSDGFIGMGISAPSSAEYLLELYRNVTKSDVIFSMFNDDSDGFSDSGLIIKADGGDAGIFLNAASGKGFTFSLNDGDGYAGLGYGAGITSSLDGIRFHRISGAAPPNTNVEIPNRLDGGTGSFKVVNASHSLTVGTGTASGYSDSTLFSVKRSSIISNVSIVGRKYRLTNEGGFAIRAVNNTGHTSIKGELLRAATGYNLSVTTTSPDDQVPLGVTYESGVPQASYMWVVVSGLAQVLLKDSSASGAGGWAETSDANGRAEVNVSVEPNPASRHDEEIGHCIENVAGGTDKLAYVILHFR